MCRADRSDTKLFLSTIHYCFPCFQLAWKATNDLATQKSSNGTEKEEFLASRRVGESERALRCTSSRCEFMERSWCRGGTDWEEWCQEGPKSTRWWKKAHVEDAYLPQKWKRGLFSSSRSEWLWFVSWRDQWSKQGSQAEKSGDCFDFLWAPARLPWASCFQSCSPVTPCMVSERVSFLERFDSHQCWGGWVLGVFEASSKLGSFCWQTRHCLSYFCDLCGLVLCSGRYTFEVLVVLKK